MGLLLECIPRFESPGCLSLCTDRGAEWALSGTDSQRPAVVYSLN